jgi:hypothetical protein
MPYFVHVTERPRSQSLYDFAIFWKIRAVAIYIFEPFAAMMLDTPYNFWATR